MVSSDPAAALVALAPHLRLLLPADLYALAWRDPSPATLQRIFAHLRTLQRLLSDHVPREITVDLPPPGRTRHLWHEATLMFTDLEGFTGLVSAYDAQGHEGAQTLLTLLNTYFTVMIDIVHHAGGTILEFTGDALLAQFATDWHHNDTVRAVRAGLRMQRAMQRFVDLQPVQRALTMRIGIHSGRFLSALIGTPRRMEHVLLGDTIMHTKYAEGAGDVGRVCLTTTAYARVQDQFRVAPAAPGHVLVVDDLSEAELGLYDLVPARRRPSGLILLDRHPAGVAQAIAEAVQRIQPLASYVPTALLQLLVENVSRRQLPPMFPVLTVIFMNLVGLPEALAQAAPAQEAALIASFSCAFARINTAVEAQGGVLQRVTYQVGSDIMIYFGVPHARADDVVRAASTALAMRDIVSQLPPLDTGATAVPLACKIGLACGRGFAAEIGAPRSRREFDIHGEAINLAAHLMTQAAVNQILLPEPVAQALEAHFECVSLGLCRFKGYATPMPVFALHG